MVLCTSLDIAPLRVRELLRRSDTGVGPLLEDLVGRATCPSTSNLWSFARWSCSFLEEVARALARVSTRHACDGLMERLCAHLPSLWHRPAATSLARLAVIVARVK